MEAERFKKMLDGTLDKMFRFEKSWPFDETSGYSRRKESDYFNIQSKIISQVDPLPPDERNLFNNLIEVFGVKHGATKLLDLVRRHLKKEKKDDEGKYIGLLGPLSVGKSTVAQALVEDLEARFVVREPYQENPFWGKSQEDKEYMLRSQIYFLLSNTKSDWEAVATPGISVSDTASLTDIFIWAEWYRRVGHLSEDEYKSYMKLVDLLGPILPRPDLIVALTPNSVEDLRRGLEKRSQAEPWRKGELVFDKEKLKVQTEMVKQVAEEVEQRWNVPVLALTVNPIDVYEDIHNDEKEPLLRYDYVWRVRSKLGLLSELLEPPPEEVVEKVLDIIDQSEKAVVVNLHSKGMFTGKTTTICRLTAAAGEKKTVVFQPRAAIHSDEEGFEEQEKAVISRDDLKIEATTTEDNDLWSIVRMVADKKINSKETPYILIDDVMLFIANASDPEDAVAALNALRMMGFNVVVNGIDYTFQEEPFSFMHDLLEYSLKDPNWHEIEMSTRCRYCGERARGTRRWRLDEKRERVGMADFSDTTYVAGDSEYEPVCCKEHKSCNNQPVTFKRKPLPTER